mgnify:CR=1 FL=1
MKNVISAACVIFGLIMIMVTTLSLVTGELGFANGALVFVISLLLVVNGNNELKKGEQYED